MCDVIKHRGPDQHGIYIDDLVSLGQRRLSIIDLSENGRQPLFNENRTIVLICNGEIYNFKELREELVNKGHIFKSNSDSEVIIHAYEEHKEECVKNFRGMFAFALYDIKERKLILVRDRFGIKPLYYAKTKERFLFASEIKSMLQDQALPRQINYLGYDLYLAFQCIPSEETMFKGINKLGPGQILTFKDGDYSIKKYWNFPTLKNSSEEHNLTEILRKEFDLLSESVKIHLISDVPVGILLSGGLDSSSVVGLIRAKDREKIKTFTVGFGRSDDELSFAKKVSEHFNTEHQEFIVKPKLIPAVLEKIVWHMDEPLADGGAIPTFLVSQVLKSLVKVILVGEGGDETFGGYNWYKLSVFPLQILPASIKRRLYFYLTTFCYQWRGKKDNVYNKFRGMFNQEIKDKKNIFQLQMSLFEIKNILPNSLLMKVDKMTMAHSIEARVPFLDHRLVEYLFSTPGRFSQKIIEKKELRTMMKNILPREILTRKKQGFILPTNQWLRNDLRDFCYDKLVSGTSHALTQHSRKYLEGLFKKSNGLIEIEKISLLWRLLIFEIWNETYIK